MNQARPTFHDSESRWVVTIIVTVAVTATAPVTHSNSATTGNPPATKVIPISCYAPTRSAATLDWTLSLRGWFQQAKADSDQSSFVYQSGSGLSASEVSRLAWIRSPSKFLAVLYSRKGR
ncbi:hypothetical protein BDV93DRAFT_508645 [Ceratobasidium sp. AG-I]|nr:hypothetical protein BDV93DRAFT_508645 [Ceratobasidium sp. AG-I]